MWVGAGGKKITQFPSKVAFVLICYIVIPGLPSYLAAWYIVLASPIP